MLKKPKMKKNNPIMCYYWTLDPHVTPHDYYAICRLGMDAMVRNNIDIRKDYYKMTCQKTLTVVNGLPLRRNFFEKVI